MRIVIIGGVATGASVAARYRRLNEEAEIMILEQGPHVSFSNCGLPYHLSSEIKNSSDLILMDPVKFMKQYNIIARTNSKVTQVKPTENKVIINGTSELEYDQLVIAPGTDPLVPPIKGIDLIEYSTLKTVVDVERIVNALESKAIKRVCVIGGGFIGIEAAENLTLRGIKTSLIDGADYLIRPLDQEMSGFGHNELRKNGVDLHIGKKVEYFEEGQVVLGDGTRIYADYFILCIGVVPATKFLKDSGIELTDRGYIVVDENYQTNFANIHAGGDAILVKNMLTNEIQPLALAGPANKQGRLIADVLGQLKVNETTYIGSSIVKIFDLNIAMTGLNMSQAKANGYNAKFALAAPTDRVGIMPGATPVYIKVIFDEDTRKVLGAQAISKGASDKRIDVIATGIKLGITIDQLQDLELCYAPTYSTGKDVVNKIGYIASNLANGEYEQINFTELNELLNQNAQIIDVREVMENRQERVKGVQNIPMSELRSRLDELDRSKKVYVHCKSGQRSYNMTKMLIQNGFEAVNVAGGFDFIEMYDQDQCALNKEYKSIIERG
ncbi:MAG: FAD-dependent oxidoreductase [Mycoplasmatales bacterium]